MGSGCSRNTNAQNVISQPNEDYQIVQELLPFLSLESSYNINHKYNLFFEIYKDSKVGKGIFQTNAYKSKITKEELQKKRIEFWETRTEGDLGAWETLRGACGAAEEDALAILAAMELKLVHDTLQLAYDKTGERYEVPIFCINEPSSFDIPKKVINLKENISSEKITIKVRNQGQDTNITIPQNITSEELKSLYIKEQKGNIDKSKLRLFYGGKELEDKRLIYDFKVSNNVVVIAMMRK